jgi:hypothetical protein
MRADYGYHNAAGQPCAADGTPSRFTHDLGCTECHPVRAAAPVAVPAWVQRNVRRDVPRVASKELTR